MKLRRLTHFLLASAAATAVFAFAPGASAQTITVGVVTRDATLRSDAANPYWISRADCLANDTFHIPLVLTDFGSYPLEVWVGDSTCSESANRIGTTAICWKVAQASGGSLASTYTLDLKVRDIIGRHIPSGQGAGTAADCEGPTDSTGAAPLNINIYLMQAGGTTVIKEAIYVTNFDLKGPAAPVGVTKGVGQNMLAISWSQNTDTDVYGYQFFCDPVRGTEGTDASVKTASGNPYRELDATDDGSAGTSGAGGEAGSAGTAGSAGAAGSGGSAGSGGTDAGDTDGGTDGAADSSTADAATGSTCKPDSFLQPGVVPIKGYCGSATKTDTEGRITDLVNFQEYAIGVAAVDLVGNVGPLSSIVCETPQPIDDFFKIYKQAGGEGGGSFCSIHGPIGKSAPLAALGLLALAAGALVRRRRS